MGETMFITTSRDAPGAESERTPYDQVLQADRLVIFGCHRGTALMRAQWLLQDMRARRPERGFSIGFEHGDGRLELLAGYLPYPGGAAAP